MGLVSRLKVGLGVWFDLLSSWGFYCLFAVGLCLVSGGLEDLTVSHIQESLEQVQEMETHLPGHYCAMAG